MAKAVVDLHPMKTHFFDKDVDTKVLCRADWEQAAEHVEDVDCERCLSLYNELKRRHAHRTVQDSGGKDE
jgi:hypothetical protein